MQALSFFFFPAFDAKLLPLLYFMIHFLFFDNNLYSAAWPREGQRSLYHDPDRMICVHQHPHHIVASLDKRLYNDYLRFVASNQQQIQWTRIRRNFQEHWIIRSS